MLVPIFAKKGAFFQWEARIREIKKKGSFSAMSLRLNFACSICLFNMFELLCITVYIRSNEKNTTYIENVLSLKQLFLLSQKGTLSYITKNKKRVLLKKGMFYWASKSAISVEKEGFFSSKIREKEVFFILGYEHDIRFGPEWEDRG